MTRHPEIDVDPQVRTAWRASFSERTPAALDAAVIAGARRALAEPGRRRAAWLRPLALAASVGLCFGTSLLARELGYSVALGAFLAGSLVAESGQGRRVVGLIAPVRDMFAAIFFVSVGMSIDPAVIARHWGAVAALRCWIVCASSCASRCCPCGVSGWYWPRSNATCCPTVYARALTSRADSAAWASVWTRTPPKSCPKRDSMNARGPGSSGRPGDDSVRPTLGGIAAGAGPPLLARCSAFRLLAHSSHSPVGPAGTPLI